jgi:hypothetical protein
MKKTKILGAIVTAGLLGASHGALIIKESFSQDTSGGTGLSGKAGGTGLSGNWSTNNTNNIISPTTIGYGDLSNAGGELQMTASGGTDAFVSTSSALFDAGLLADGATLWFSFMHEKTGVGGNTNSKGGFAFGTDRIDGAFNGTNMTNSGNGLGLQLLGSNVSAASWAGGGNFNSTGALGTLAADTSYFFVGRIEWGATAGDVETITLYNPSTSSLGTLGAAISTTTMAGVDQTLFDTISMTTRDAAEGIVKYDEIRFGSSYAFVSPIPEPSAALLGAIGFIALLRRRRK